MGETLALAASVVVKWFKEGEKLEREGLALRDGILDGRVSAVTSEWLLLEGVQAMVKDIFFYSIPFFIEYYILTSPLNQSLSGFKKKGGMFLSIQGFF